MGSDYCRIKMARCRPIRILPLGDEEVTGHWIILESPLGVTRWRHPVASIRPKPYPDNGARLTTVS